MHTVSAVLNLVVKPRYFQQGEAFIAWSKLMKILWSLFTLGIELVHGSCFGPWQGAALLGAVEGEGTLLLLCWVLWRVRTPFCLPVGPLLTQGKQSSVISVLCMTQILAKGQEEEGLAHVFGRSRREARGAERTSQQGWGPAGLCRGFLHHLAWWSA